MCCVLIRAWLFQVLVGFLYKEYAARQEQVKIVYKTDDANTFDFNKISQLSLDFWIVCLICVLYYAVSIGNQVDFPKYVIVSCLHFCTYTKHI